mmetsp:Transcript_14303/g.21125  ORF Transcript_14303/g.21125 Transcript_14303/m.21125 type:complete len:288 (-) Transcript_14303:204-1067(-)
MKCVLWAALLYFSHPAPAYAVSSKVKASNITNACDVCSCWIRSKEGFIHCENIDEIIFIIPGYLQDDHGDLWPMKNVWLHKNAFRTVPSVTFNESKHVTNIYLHNNPSLRTIEHGAFDGLTALENLIIHHTSLQSFPSPLAPESRSLERLWLHEGNVSNITAETFIGMTSLKELFFDNNEINHIDAYSFADLNSLELLRLQDNPVSIDNCSVLCGIPSSCQVELPNSSNNTLYHIACGCSDSEKYGRSCHSECSIYGDNISSSAEGLSYNLRMIIYTSMLLFVTFFV